QGLMVLETINKDMGLKLGVQSIFDHSSVRELARYIAGLAPAVASTEAVRHGRVEAPVEPTLARAASNAVVNGKDCVAVVGMAGRFPGAGTIEAFWDNLKAGADCVTEVPAERWEVERWYDPDPSKPDKTYCKWGGFLQDVDKFDPACVRISPAEAQVIDPQQRLFLQTCWEGLEDA